MNFSLALSFPFTICLLIALVAAGAYGRTHVGPIVDVVHEKVGHSADLLWKGEHHRIWTSVIFTTGGWHFYGSLAMVAFAVGWLEKEQGSWIALIGFLGIHAATLLMMSAGISMSHRLVETHRGNLLWYTSDVGPSAGYYGCLGIAIASQEAWAASVCILAIFVLLVTRLVWSSYHILADGRAMSADIAHLIAFPLGLLAWRLVSL